VKFLFIFLFAILLVRPILLVNSLSGGLFSKVNYVTFYPQLKSAYYGSQYVEKKNPGIMPDQTFESFMAAAFLYGTNPIMVTHDQPPLGRYLLSLSIILFQNVSTIVVIFFFSSAFLIFLIANQVLKNPFLALIPFGIFINEPLILGQLTTTPLLEPVQLPFIFAAIYFFIRGVSSKNYLKWFILCAFMIGFVISIRFFVLGLFLALSMIAYFIIKRKLEKKFISFLLVLPIAVAVLLLSYTKTIQDGSSIFHIFGIQKYIYYYHKSELIAPLTVWDLLIFNKWHTWWGNHAISFDPSWIVFWPIALFCSIIRISSNFVKKIKVSEAEKVIISWVIFYSILLSVGESSTRYLPPLLPFLYILTTGLIFSLIKKAKHAR